MSGAIPLCKLSAVDDPLRPELLAAVERVARSGRFVLGDEVSAFEDELARAVGVSHAVGVSSGTDALEAALRAVGVRAGDEVVLPAVSFWATCEAVLRVGAHPVFVDVAPGRPHPRTEALLAAVTPRTRAVVAVPLFGEALALGELEAALPADVALVEDAAQALGASIEGRRAGSHGRCAITSFFPAKTLGAWGDGGAVLTNDERLANRVRQLRQHAQVEPGLHEGVGGNWRLDALQAAVLRIKLPWVASWCRERVELARRYQALFSEHATGLGLPGSAGEPTYYRYVVRAPRRDRLAAWLTERGIETAVYYRLPLPLQPALARLGHRPGDFPEAEGHCLAALALPLWVGMPEAAQRRVVAEIAAFGRTAP